MIGSTSIMLPLHSDFSSIMVPLQASMIVTLPTRHGHCPDYQPFPGVPPSIVKFEDKVKLHYCMFISLSLGWSFLLNLYFLVLLHVLCEPDDDSSLFWEPNLTFEKLSVWSVTTSTTIQFLSACTCTSTHNIAILLIFQHKNNNYAHNHVCINVMYIF